MQPPQPNQQNFIRDFSNSWDIALLAMFSVTTTVQLWSRLPGSTGRRFYGFYLLAGTVLQILYVQFNTQATGKPDWVSLYITIGISLCWFSIHCLRQNYQRFRGICKHSHDPGTGILTRIYPSLPANHCTFISDITAAIGIGLFLHAAASPHLANWFFYIVVPSLIVAQLWASARLRYQRQRFIDANEEADYYTGTIQPRS